MDKLISLLPVMQIPPDLLTSLLPIGGVILVFYFLILRPQNKKQKNLKLMLAAIKKNDKIVTIGGIHGVVSNKVKENDTTVIVRIDDNIKMEFSRSAISSIITGKEDSKGKDNSKGKDDSAIST